MPISQRPQPAPLGQGNDRHQSRLPGAVSSLRGASTSDVA